MTFELNAGTNPPQGVATPGVMAFYVGNPPKLMQIFTGVGVPEFNQNNDDDPPGHNDALVRLGAKTTPAFQAVCTAGLASISANDSDFLFATDSAGVETDPTTGELMVRVQLFAKGDEGTLHRFAYNVMVLSDPVIAKIAGHIRWPQAFGDATQAVKQGQIPMFHVAAGTITPPPPGQFGGTFTEVVGADTTVPPLPVGTDYVVPYEIDNVPLGRAFVVRVRLNSGALDGPPSQFLSTALFTPVDPGVELTSGAPMVDGLDFTMSFTTVPR